MGLSGGLTTNGGNLLPPSELGYAQITTNATQTSTTATDVPGLSVTVTTGSRPIMVIFDAVNCNNDTSGGAWIASIAEDGTVIASASGTSAAAAQSLPAHREVRRSPTPGSHTYKIQLSRFGGVTAAIAATAANPAYIQVREI